MTNIIERSETSLIGSKQPKQIFRIPNPLTWLSRHRSWRHNWLNSRFIFKVLVSDRVNFNRVLFIRLQDLHAKLSQFEPRVTSMREIADQVFVQSVTADASTQLRSKLGLLSERLSSLLRMCSQYKQLLAESIASRTPSSSIAASPSLSDRRSPYRSVATLSSEVSIYCFYFRFFKDVSLRSEIYIQVHCVRFLPF